MRPRSVRTTTETGKEETMSEIQIDRSPSEDERREMGVRDWPIWEKEESESVPIHRLCR